jgi:ankyrin repeat protein
MAGIQSESLETVKLLLAAGASANDSNTSGETPLMYAAIEDTALFRAVFDGGGKETVNKTSKDKSTALMFAAAAGKTDNVKILLDAGADVKAKTSTDITALVLAADGGNTALVAMLINAGADINIKTKSGVTPLSAALAAGAYRVRERWFTGRSPSLDLDILLDTEKPAAKALLDMLYTDKTDVKAKDANGYTLLMLAAGTNNLDMVNRLLAAKADAKAKAKSGDTAIWLAVLQDNAAVVKSLIAAGANANDKNSEGITILMIASMNGNAEMVNALMVAKADAKAKTKTGDSVICFAAYSGSAEVVNILIAAKANINDKSKDNTTVLMYAAMGGNAEVVSNLLATNANVKTKNKAGATALMAASNARVTELLLNAGSDAGVRSDLYHETPLMFAAQRGDIESFNLLVKAGAKINDSSLQNPMINYAAMGGNERIIDACIAAGQPINASYKVGLFTVTVNPLTAVFPTMLTKPVQPPGTIVGTFGSFGFIGETIKEQQKKGMPNTRVIRKLLDAGADPSGGIIGAIQYSRLDLVKYLVAAGANPGVGLQYLENRINARPVAASGPFGGMDLNEGPLTEEQIEIYAYLLSLNIEPTGQAVPFGKIKGKFPHPHRAQRVGLLSTAVK